MISEGQKDFTEKEDIKKIFSNTLYNLNKKTLHQNYLQLNWEILKEKMLSGKHNTDNKLTTSITL
jgi:hypothetical protein